MFARASTEWLQLTLPATLVLGVGVLAVGVSVECEVSLPPVNTNLKGGGYPFDGTQNTCSVKERKPERGRPAL